MLLLLALAALAIPRPGFEASSPDEAERSLGQADRWAAEAEAARGRFLAPVLLGLALAFPLGAAVTALVLQPRAERRAREGR